MTRGWIIAGWTAVAVVAMFGYETVGYFYLDSCGVSEATARGMVLKELVAKDGSAESRLKFESSRGTCEHSYLYNGPAGNLSLVVIDDFGHGPKVTSWDYANDKTH